MKRLSRHGKSAKKAVDGWLAKHAAVDLWLTRSLIWLSFAMIVANRR